MKAKTLITGILLCCSASLSWAEDFEPTEGWPYLFHDFEPATVYYHNTPAQSADVNVHLASNTLHFTDGTHIMEVSNPMQIDSVVCNNGKVLLRKGNYYVERIYATEHVILGHTKEIDYNAIGNDTNAYGIAATSSSARSVASFRNHGNIAAQRYNDMIANRTQTRTLPTINRTCIVTTTDLCHATKRGINEILTDDEKAKFKNFLKENKIKWKNIEHLKRVVNFLEANITHTTDEE